MSELIFDAPKGQRLHRYGFGVTVMSGDFWWCRERRCWTRMDDNQTGLSSHAPCRTLKAFKRHLRKHSEALTGQTVIWTNRFQGCDVKVVVQ